MSDYDLYYWSVPFRGQFVRAVLTFAGKTRTVADERTSKTHAGPVYGPQATRDARNSG